MSDEARLAITIGVGVGAAVLRGVLPIVVIDRMERRPRIKVQREWRHLCALPPLLSFASIAMAATSTLTFFASNWFLPGFIGLGVVTLMSLAYVKIDGLVETAKEDGVRGGTRPLISAAKWSFGELFAAWAVLLVKIVLVGA